MANPWRRKKIESGPGGLDLIVRNLDTQKRGMVIVMSDFAKKWGGGDGGDGGGAYTPCAPPGPTPTIMSYNLIKITLVKSPLYDFFYSFIVHIVEGRRYFCAFVQ